MSSWKPYVIDGFGLISIAIWASGSMYYWWHSDPDMYQRMGAFGVAVALAYYGLIARGRLPSSPHGLNERLHLISASGTLHMQAAHTAISNTVVIATVLKKRREAKGEKVEAPIKILADQLEDIQKSNDWVNSGYQEQLETLEVNRDALISADTLAEGEKRTTNFRELFLGSLATIQWGFGDLLVNLTNGCGVLRC